MVGYLLMSLLHIIMAPFLAAWALLDPHLDTNPYLLALVAFAGTLDKFVPFSDAIIPCALGWFALAQPLILWNIVLKIYNAVRGAGVK